MLLENNKEHVTGSKQLDLSSQEMPIVFYVLQIHNFWCRYYHIIHRSIINYAHFLTVLLCLFGISESLAADCPPGNNSNINWTIDGTCNDSLTWSGANLTIAPGGFLNFGSGGPPRNITVDQNSNVGEFTNYGSVNSNGRNFVVAGGSVVQRIMNQNTMTFGGVYNSIDNFGTIQTILNGSAGLIQSSGNGVQIKNGFDGINQGILNTLINAQGARPSVAGDQILQYDGNLPSFYQIIVNNTEFGKILFTNPGAPNNTTSTMTFGIYNTSVLQAGTYAGVMSGLTDGLVNSARSGTYGSYIWNLALQSGQTSIWDLVVAVASTDITNPLIDVSQTTNTSTSVNNAANLSGAVTVNVANGAAAYLPNRKMTIVSSTGLSGTFSGVSTSQNLSFLTPSLSYDANNVYLSYGLTPFSFVAKNINQRNVGNALTIGALGAVNSLNAPILNALFYGDYQNAQAVMDTVSGSGLAGVQSTAMQVGQMASSSVSDQIAFWRSGETMDATGRTSQEGNNPRNFLAYAPTETKVPAKGPINLKGPAGSLTAAYAPRTFRAWGSMFGGGANYLSDAGRGAAASNIGYYGGLIGVDYQVQPNILVGVALGGSSSNFNVGSLSTNGNLTGFHAGVYGAYTMGNSYIALNETFSAYGNQTTRKAGGYALMPYEQLSASFGSTEFRTRAEVGHGVLMGGLKATPFIAAEIAAYQSNAFSEQSSIYASTFALKNNGQGVNSLPTFAGLRLSNAVTLSNGWRLAPVGSVAYVHEFFPQRQFNNILMSMPGADFNVAGPRSTYNLVQTKVGAQLNLNEKLALYTDFQGEFSPVSQSYGGKGGMKYVW